MPTLFSWSLKAHGPELLAHGIVSGHPKLWEGTHIRTSPVRRVTEDEGGLLLETASGSVYLLRMEELDGLAGGPALPLPPPEELGSSPDLWERCIQARERAARREEDALRALEAPGTLRLRTVGTTALSGLWSGQGGTVARITISMHLGMFEDSVLLQGELEDASGYHRADLRTFSHFDRMETYHCSPDIEAVQILNEGLRDISFVHAGRTVLCPAGTTTQIAVKGRPDAGGLPPEILE